MTLTYITSILLNNMSLKKFASTISLSPQRLFLIDGIGAIISALLLSILLGQNFEFFGMPQEVLYKLAALAGIFAIYSISCYLLLRSTYKPFLLIIAIANLLYCCITLVLMYKFFYQLTVAGVLYFVAEKIIVCCIVYIEFITIKKQSHTI